MKIDAFVYEIGSTTTIINAFDQLESLHPIFIGQGEAPTSVTQGDVTIGLDSALQDLKSKLHTTHLEAKETFATSSAAGGLKMSVHGLVHDMTVKAAKEAALGAGANIKLVTSGIIDDLLLEKIKNENLNVIMISGGVDYGETKTALENAKKIASLHLPIPVIYAGNIQNQEAVKAIFAAEGISEQLFITKNVYPKIDTLEVDEARKIIQDVFEVHIVHAPGMEKVRNVVDGDIIPTPGAVMKASILLQKEIGDLITFDVGGATTDLHSVSNNSIEIDKILIAPEPFAKRTVEGDLGVYINRDNLISQIGKKRLMNDLAINQEQLDDLLSHYAVIPTDEQIPLVQRLSEGAVEIALMRHAGKYIHLYGTNGKTTLAEGKDLTNVKTIIGTGGPLTKLIQGETILKKVMEKRQDTFLKPQKDVTILIDHDYIMASLGVLSMRYENAALTLLKSSLYRK